MTSDLQEFVTAKEGTCGAVEVILLLNVGELKEAFFLICEGMYTEPTGTDHDLVCCYKQSTERNK